MDGSGCWSADGRRLKPRQVVADLAPVRHRVGRTLLTCGIGRRLDGVGHRGVVVQVDPAAAAGDHACVKEHRVVHGQRL